MPATTTNKATDFDKTGVPSHQQPSPEEDSLENDSVKEPSQLPTMEPRDAGQPGNVPDTDHGHSQRGEGEESPPRVPRRMTTPELERLTFPEHFRSARDNPYNFVIYQDPHYYNRVEIIGRFGPDAPGAWSTAGTHIQESTVRAGHEDGEGHRASSRPSQDEVGSAGPLHQESESRTGERSADLGGRLAKEEEQDAGEGEGGTSEDLAGSLDDDKA